MRKGVSKQELIDSLATTLRLTRTEVTDLELASNNEHDDTVIIRFEGGGTQKVNIAFDSGIAIIRDVCRGID